VDCSTKSHKVLYRVARSFLKWFVLRELHRDVLLLFQVSGFKLIFELELELELVLVLVFDVLQLANNVLFRLENFLL
jgi:hypothetical protein